MAQMCAWMKIFSAHLREIIIALPMEASQIQEIRLRSGAPLMLVYAHHPCMIDAHGQTVTRRAQAYHVSKKEIEETLTLISHYSLYAYEDEIRQGFITIAGGHRIGLAGKVILDNTMHYEKIRSIQYIASLNIRLAHQVKGCADRVIPYLYDKNRIRSTLIVSPPGCGKTTLLRDIIRQISDGSSTHPGCNAAVVDERSELAACYQGTPQNDMGMRTDILDGCPKAEGMLMLLRTMTPEVIAVDEIGSREDLDAMRYVMHCGCALMATVHGRHFDDLRQKPVLREMIEAKMFERCIILSQTGQAGKVEAILDGEGHPLYQIDGGVLHD